MTKQDLIKNIRKVLNQKKSFLDKRTFNAYDDKISNNIFLKNAKIKTLENINAELLGYTNLINTKKKLEEEKIRKVEERRIKKENNIIENNVKFLDMTDYAIGQDHIVKIIMTLKSFMGQNVIINIKGQKIGLFSAGDDILNLSVPFENFNSWWEEQGKWNFFGNSYFFLYPDAKMYFYGENLNIPEKRIIQFFQGANNGLCFFNPIREWAENKYDEAKGKSTKDKYKTILKNLTNYEIEYKNGVTEENINLLCNELKIDVSILSPLTEKTYLHCKSSIKGLKHFKFINNRLNHIELNEYLKNDEPIFCTNEEMIKIKNELTKNNEYHIFSRFKTKITSIQTLENNYKLKNETSEIFHNFEIETDLINCKIDDITQSDLSKFIKNGTHYNGTIDFKDVKTYDINDVYHIDMKKAYASFYLCKFYEGFLGKITDFRKTDKIEGVGIYYIYDLVIPENHKFYAYNDKMKIYFSNNIYTSPELKFLSSIGSTYKILCGCWGVQPKDFRFNNEMLENNNYSLWTGKCDCHHLKNKISMDGDEDLYNVILSTLDNDKKIIMNANKEITVYYDKPHNYHLGHITSFILSYQRLNIIEQFLTMDYDNIIRICVDGIYSVTEPKILKNSFRPKNDEKTFLNVAGNYYISNMEHNLFIQNIYSLFLNPSNLAENREHNKNELHLGAGGCGKTHINLLDKGLINVLYVAPSWKLARNKNKEYKIHTTVLARVDTKDIEKINYVKRFSNVLIIDECSMMSEEQKNRIFDLYKDFKIIFCGDLGYQLSSFEGQEMTTKGFNKIIEYKTNHRCKDDKLLFLLEQLRTMIKSTEITGEEMIKYVKEYIKDSIINKDKLKTLYKIEDMILTGTKLSRDDYTNMFKDLKKYYVEETTRFYSKGDIFIDEEPPSSIIRHGYTTHSIQGETAHHNLYIDLNGMWDRRMLYTALSRAKYLNQIYLII
jgi:hypothetical protein